MGVELASGEGVEGVFPGCIEETRIIGDIYAGVSVNIYR